MKIDRIGCVDSWHSYRPRSSSRTDLMRSAQWPMCRACSTRKRSSLLYVDRPTVSSWKSRRRIHDTVVADGPLLQRMAHGSMARPPRCAITRELLRVVNMAAAVAAAFAGSSSLDGGGAWPLDGALPLSGEGETKRPTRW